MSVKVVEVTPYLSFTIMQIIVIITSKGTVSIFQDTRNCPLPISTDVEFIVSTDSTWVKVFFILKKWQHQANLTKSPFKAAVPEYWMLILSPWSAHTGNHISQIINPNP